MSIYSAFEIVVVTGIFTTIGALYMSRRVSNPEQGPTNTKWQPSIPPVIPPSPSYAIPDAPQVGSTIVYVDEPISWEYKRIACNLMADVMLSTEELNALGADGWELTDVVTHAAFAHFYFKRRAGGA